MKLISSIAFLLVTTLALDPICNKEELDASNFLKCLELPSIEWQNRALKAVWNYATNVTGENCKRMNTTITEFAAYMKNQSLTASQFNWREFSSEDLKRQLKFYADLRDGVLPSKKYDRLQNITNAMKANYAAAKICDYHHRSKCDLRLEPDIKQIFANSRDPSELKHVWLEWRKAAGAPVRSLFEEYVELKNQAARLNNYSDCAAQWLSPYEDDNFEQQLENVLGKVRPLYLQLHAYVRRKLRKQYGREIVTRKGSIPAHLLGNNWAQTWDGIAQLLEPFSGCKDTDITQELDKQCYTVKKIFELGDDFYKSLNLRPLPFSFWKKSMLEKPADKRTVICHSSAFDFSKNSDVRIKMCACVNDDYFKIIHHELGHIQYYLQYKDLPLIYREGANPGFHEAIGDAIVMSATSTKHLYKIGLVKDCNINQKERINQLMKTALHVIPLLYYSYVLDKFRWNVFRGQIASTDYNREYWKLSEEVQGLGPPANRTECDFDIGAKFHVSADVEYIRYCVSHILQFQFHEALCKIAKEYVPGDDSKLLMDCDIYQSAAAGCALGDLMRLGRSKPWPEALKALTGQCEMKASGILGYFQLLHDWLIAENARSCEFIGWTCTV